MRMNRIATATMLVLAVSGFGAAGSGTAFAGTDPVDAQAKASAAGGSDTAGDVFQQNMAQSSRQNNNCNNVNMNIREPSLTAGRATGRCVTSDGSLTAFSRIHDGPVQAQGGTSASSLLQQNTAQRGRQNNNCHDRNDADFDVDGGRVEAHCGNKDVSFSKHARIKGGGARAEGGSSTGSDVFQQNVAQGGRQNNACDNPNRIADLTVTGGRVEAHCGNKDASFSKHARIKGGGARAEGGSSTGGGVNQQNFAQEGRQNNACNNFGADSRNEVTGGRVETRCGNKDVSFSKHTRIKGGGARAEGGPSTGDNLFQQNVAQEGRQNNSCDSPNFADSSLDVSGGRVDTRCGNKDASFSKHAHTKGGGARAEGGSAIGEVDQQNIAQEGRQNNACNNPNGFSDIDVTGGRLDTRCGNKDVSFSKHARIKGGGARAEGGSSTGDDMFQQNIAQEGRQNNACNNSNFVGIEVDGDRLEGSCGNKDGSFSKHTRVKGGGARAEGGSNTTAADLLQQNIAQEGRQNNNCNNLDNDATLTVTGGRVQARCGHKDFSFNRKTFVKGGGAHAEGGSATGAAVSQQNIAQEGRQNNSCHNVNLPAEGIDLSGSRLRTGCKTVDHSANLHTADIGGGAQAQGGSSTAELLQQNSAQEGRQNNSCNNSNNLTVTTTGSRTQTHCVAIDRSTNIGTINR
ncbi:hypothetical protein [Streptomyces sp. NPDC051776]|uniref:hypothetical protein n=1 Tax=Streptomyces sp. NPDC051776 TaxID=3155414 RepID=UPI00341FED6B